jgi:hypothetical protein
MKELIQRLSALDEDATAAVKIILHFDTLLGQGAGLESFVRGAAVLAGYPAGLAHPQHQLWLRVDAGGRAAAPVTDQDVIRAWPHRDLDDGSGAVVWVERPQESVLDGVLLERLAAGVHLTLERVSPVSVDDDVGAVEILLSTASDDARRKAARRLRLSENCRVHVVATAADAPPPFSRRSAVVPTHVGDVRASIVEAVRFSTACVAGVGSAVRLHDVPTSWSQALVALRLATRIAPVARWDDLGALALLASVPAEAAAQHPDVVAVREAAGEPWGLDTLEAVARTDSSRAASAVLGLHHSTIQSRQARLEELLRFRLGTADGRTRAMVALTLHRLTENRPADHYHPPPDPHT